LIKPNATLADNKAIKVTTNTSTKQKNIVTDTTNIEPLYKCSEGPRKKEEEKTENIKGTKPKRNE
jgi:hypothetical protein